MAKGMRTRGHGRKGPHAVLTVPSVLTGTQLRLSPVPLSAGLHTPASQSGLGALQTPCPCARDVTVFSFDRAPFQAYSQSAIEMSGWRQGKAIAAQLTGGFPLNS